jgi:GntP family gluconate:H+ symporter
MPLMATVLASSLYSVHCLIPSHPGALAAAGIIHVNIGLLILLGTLFAIPAAVAAYFWSRFMTAGKNYPPAEISATEKHSAKENLPPVLLSFLPIIVPLILITIRSLLNLLDKDKSSLFTKIFNIPGEPVIALSIGVLLALLLVRSKSVKTINALFSEAIEKAGPILIVTAAGGMFGMVIKSTGTGEALGKLLAGSNIGIFVPFLIAVVMKTAQGSSTVAIITTASFIGPMLAIFGLDSEWGRLLAMLSMGAGSMVISHANDSYFWVVTKFSEIDPSVTLKVYSSSTIVMGLVVLLLVWITSVFVL